MKKTFILISFLGLTLTRCSENPINRPSIDIPNTGPYRSSELTFFMGEIKKQDGINFPDKYEIVEENDTLYSDKEGLHNACIKLSHQDILKFIKENKLFPPDTLKYGVFQPSSIALIARPNYSKSFSLHTKNQVELYADTTIDKLYIAKYY